MKKKSDVRALIVSTVAALIASGAFAEDAPTPQDSGAAGACYGVAKAGNNACATAGHSCAGMASKDNAPDDWVQASKDDCLKQGGTLKPGAT